MRLWIAAAEASGDALGAELVETLRRMGPVQARGLAGPRMRAVGVEAVRRAEEATALGLVEVLGSLGGLARLLAHLNREARAFRPDVALTIDSPGLLNRHGRHLKRQGIAVAHWVAPQVWAWRPGRAARLGRSAHTVLCLLPFEPPLFHRHGIRAIFTGNPAARPRRAPPREELILAPGSRPQELRRLVPVLCRVAAEVTRRWPEARFVVPVAPTVSPAALAALPGRRVNGLLGLAGATGAVVASGTATLELAAQGIPMVAVYSVHPATWAVGRALVRGVDHLTLPNILAGRRIIPEHLQRLDPAAIAADLLALRGEAGIQQRRALAPVIEALRGPGAVERAAHEVLRLARR